MGWLVLGGWVCEGVCVWLVCLVVVSYLSKFWFGFGVFCLGLVAVWFVVYDLILLL